MNTNTPERALRQVVREASAFYLLGYSSARNPQDGKFHKIGVKVKRPGIDVRARRGYWAPNATELEKARTEAAAAEAIPADVTERDGGALDRAGRAAGRRLGRRGARRRRPAGGDGRVDAARRRAGRADPARTVSIAVEGRRRRSIVRREPRRRRALVPVAARRGAAAAHRPRRGRQHPRRRSAAVQRARPVRRRSSRSARRCCSARARSPTRGPSPTAGRRARSPAASSPAPIACSCGFRCTARRRARPTCRRG